MTLPFSDGLNVDAFLQRAGNEHVPDCSVTERWESKPLTGTGERFLACTIWKMRS
jgi:hypothetical protein